MLFRNRDEYVARLKRLEPQIELTVGILPGGPEDRLFLRFRRAARRYVLPRSDPPAVFRDGHASRRAWPWRPTPGSSKAWPCTWSPFTNANGYCTVGGIDANRLQYARYRTLNQGFYLPLDQLAAMGRRVLQQREDIRQLYSEAAGLAAFLMDYDRGRYRRVLADYLQTIYQGRDNARTLASLAGVPLADLDRQYREFLNVADADLESVPWAPRTQNLSLGRTAVTDDGLKHLAALQDLEWLDVAYTAVGDAGLAHVKAAAGLNHLIAEHTRLTDAALETIAGFRNLEILDLTGTQITDEGLKHLAALSKLRELWIGQTAISDAGLEHLSGLKNLETLDVSGAKVTLEGFQRLRPAWPRLKTQAAASP